MALQKSSTLLRETLENYFVVSLRCEKLRHPLHFEEQEKVGTLVPVDWFLTLL
jgi:hypothetical protein